MSTSLTEENYFAPMAIYLYDTSAHIKLYSLAIPKGLAKFQILTPAESKPKQCANTFLTYTAAILQCPITCGQ